MILHKLKEICKQTVYSILMVSFILSINECRLNNIKDTIKKHLTFLIDSSKNQNSNTNNSPSPSVSSSNKYEQRMNNKIRAAIVMINLYYPPGTNNHLLIKNGGKNIKRKKYFIHYYNLILKSFIVSCFNKNISFVKDLQYSSNQNTKEEHNYIEYPSTQNIKTSNREVINFYNRNDEQKVRNHTLANIILIFIISFIFFILSHNYNKLNKNLLFSVYPKRQFPSPKRERLVLFKIRIREKKLPEKQHQEKKYKRIFQQLLEIVETKKLFLDPNLTQQDVIKYLGTNRNYLYKALKIYTDTNFKGFINSFRIRHAKNIIEAKHIYNEKYEISDIFSQCGFSTNESFYRTFKSATGTTPGKYAKTIDKN